MEKEQKMKNEKEVEWRRWSKRRGKVNTFSLRSSPKDFFHTYRC